jgi:diaminohydroxyphosphoribosylaminopyrimidine deaminase/5-amino-6-(5-phosphoribosylamino)uracil reductase
VHRPVRVLLDGRLRVPPDSALYSAPDPDRTWVLHRPGARGAPARREAGVRLLPVRGRGRHVDLGRAMELLAEQGLTTVLVEGGGGLAAALLRGHLVDEIHWFTAPLLLGADGRPALGPLAWARLRDATRLAVDSPKRIGDDWHWQARL